MWALDARERHDAPARTCFYSKQINKILPGRHEAGAGCERVVREGSGPWQPFQISNQSSLGLAEEGYPKI